MDQLIPSRATLGESFRGCFHPPVFQTFPALLAGGIVGQGPRTISEVGLATGGAANGTPDVPGPARRRDRRPGATDHQRGRARHRRGGQRHPDTASAVFHAAAWEGDDLGIVLAMLILTPRVPGGVVWIVVDDTRCPKRRAQVAFGGIVRDAGLSTTKHKTR